MTTYKSFSAAAYNTLYPTTVKDNQYMTYIEKELLDSGFTEVLASDYAAHFSHLILNTEGEGDVVFEKDGVTVNVTLEDGDKNITGISMDGKEIGVKADKKV